jgi:CAP12/Pycsar effector protein, TIR domain
MDIRIRRNEICVIGLPRCDFVFSSTRTCFIGYGFRESALEMEIIRDILTQQGIQAVEAAGALAPGQNAFCAKICSKIIVSQFCVILLNNDLQDGREVPNANVNMEYGLMLGFNKFVVPFQREEQKLPFNLAGLDTIKYTNQNFRGKAQKAIEHAIAATTQDVSPLFNPDQILEMFLLSRGLMVVPLTTEGDRTLFEFGRALGFNMLMTFDGMKYLYFGNFSQLRPELVLWRVRTLARILAERFGSFEQRAGLGMLTMDNDVVAQLTAFLTTLTIFVLVTGEQDRKEVETQLASRPLPFKTEVVSIESVTQAFTSDSE